MPTENRGAYPGLACARGPPQMALCPTSFHMTRNHWCSSNPNIILCRALAAFVSRIEYAARLNEQ